MAWPSLPLAPRKLYLCFAGDCAGTGSSEARIKELEAALHDAELAKLGAYVLDLWRLTFCLCRVNMGLSSPPSPPLCSAPVAFYGPSTTPLVGRGIKSFLHEVDKLGSSSSVDLSTSHGKMGHTSQATRLGAGATSETVPLTQFLELLQRDSAVCRIAEMVFCFPCADCMAS